MENFYEIWKSYTVFVLEKLFACADRTEHFPVPLQICMWLLPVLAAEWYLPHWVFALLFVSIALPFLWFFATAVQVFFTAENIRKRR